MVKFFKGTMWVQLLVLFSLPGQAQDIQFTGVIDQVFSHKNRIVIGDQQHRLSTYVVVTRDKKRISLRRLRLGQSVKYTIREGNEAGRGEIVRIEVVTQNAKQEPE